MEDKRKGSRNQSGQMGLKEMREKAIAGHASSIRVET